MTDVLGVRDMEKSLMTCRLWLDQGMSRGKNLPRWGRIKFGDWAMESSILTCWFETLPRHSREDLK